jgi:hypothetical protein
MVAGGAVAACGSSPRERAAAGAVDACIAALEPVADGRPPSSAVLHEAADDAEDSARTDEHWQALARVLRRAADTAGTPEGDAAVAALVDECRQSRDFVRRGGREPDEA